MAPSRTVKRRVIFSSATANGFGTDIEEKGVNHLIVTDFRNLMVTITGANSANLTVKAQGAKFLGASTTAPDFSSAADVGNEWDYVSMVDHNQETPITGDTGVIFGGASDGVRQFVINVDLLDVVNFEISSYVAGDVTVSALVATNA